MADLFPLGLAIATLIILFFTYVYSLCHLLVYHISPAPTRSLVLDLTIKNMPTARPAVDVGLLYVLSIFWLGMCMQA